MSLMNVFSIAGSAMNAQSVRLNTVASNLSNAESVGGTPEDTYHARNPVFRAIQQQADAAYQNASLGVQVVNIEESKAPLKQEFRPEHPLANENGYVFLPNVNMVEEMANMISASRSYQTNADMMNTAKQMMLQTLNIGNN